VNGLRRAAAQPIKAICMKNPIQVLSFTTIPGQLSFAYS
jgi:hypothetical protein